MQSPKKDARQILPSHTPKRLQFSAFHSLHLWQKGCISACIELQTYSVSAQSCYCSFTPAQLSMALLPVMLTNHFCPVLKTSQFLGVLSLPLNWRQREWERAHKRKWKKRVKANIYKKCIQSQIFFHCGFSNIHHSKFKPDFQEPRPQWFLLWYLTIW